MYFFFTLACVLQVSPMSTATPRPGSADSSSFKVYRIGAGELGAEGLGTHGLIRRTQRANYFGIIFVFLSSPIMRQERSTKQDCCCRA